MGAQITSTNSTRTAFGWFVAHETQLHQWFQQQFARSSPDAPARAADGDAMFAAAVAADMSHERDWLRLAEQLGDAEQRRFCYEKALHLNPACEAARQALAAPPAWQAPARELALGEA